jgi:hypothetical protein
MYFAVEFDSSLPSYTHFREPKTASGQTVDAFNFMGNGRWLSNEPLFVAVQEVGLIYDINMGAFDLPIVNDRVHRIIGSDQKLAQQVQFVPILYNDITYFILNPLTALKCVDEKKSIVTKWKKKDLRPDRIGDYWQIIDLHILPKNVEGVDVFRIKGWEVVMIFSSRIVDLMKENNIQGAKFELVC